MLENARYNWWKSMDEQQCEVLVQEVDRFTANRIRGFKSLKYNATVHRAKEAPAGRVECGLGTQRVAAGRSKAGWRWKNAT